MTETIEDRVAKLESDMLAMRELVHTLGGMTLASDASAEFHEYPKAMRKWVDGKVADEMVVHSTEEEKKLGAGWGDPSPVKAGAGAPAGAEAKPKAIA